MIPGAFVQDLLARVDIVEIVGRSVALKKAGVNYKGLCPFHGEKSPSFIVSPTRQTYHCFGCGAHGDAIRFLSEQHGLGFVDAVTELAQQVGMAVPENASSVEERAAAAAQRERSVTLCEILSKAAEHYKSQLQATPQAVHYLKARGLSSDMVARFELGWAPEGWRSLASAFARYDDPLLVEAGLVIVSGEDPATQKRYDRFRERVMFPIRNVKGEVIAFGGRILNSGEPKYLNSPETPLFIKGRELYGLYEARAGLRDKGYALVTEGYMDVVALAQMGFPNAVATLGTACSAEHVHKLLRFTERVVFSFDGDAAGRRAAGRALEAALPHASDTRNFRFLFLPAEHDPDSYIRAHGTQAFEQCVQKALPLSQQLLSTAEHECDMNHAEGRARMLAQAKPLWNALPEGALRRQLLAELAQKAKLPLTELGALWSLDGGAHEAERFDMSWERANEKRWTGHSDPQREKRFTKGKGRFASAEHESSATRRLPRSAPKTPEDRIVQILFGHSEYWAQLSMDEHELLHALPPPYGPLIAWLECDLSTNGPRPWAILSHALRDDSSIDKAALGIADGDADPEATFNNLRRAVDLLLDRQLRARTQELIAQAAKDPNALIEYREVFRHWEEVKSRLSILPCEE